MRTGGPGDRRPHTSAVLRSGLASLIAFTAVTTALLATAVTAGAVPTLQGEFVNPTASVFASGLADSYGPQDPPGCSATGTSTMAFAGTGTVSTGSYPGVMTYSGSITLGAQQYTVNPFTGPLTSDPIYGFPASYGVVQSVTGTFSVTNGGVITETGTFNGLAPPLGDVGTNTGSCYGLGAGDELGYSGLSNGALTAVDANVTYSAIAQGQAESGRVLLRQRQTCVDQPSSGNVGCSFSGGLLNFYSASAQAPVVTVTPSAGLSRVGADSVSVTVTGGGANRHVQVQQCAQTTGVGTCSGLLDTTLDADGNLSVDLDLRYDRPGTTPERCDTGPAAETTCFVAVVDTTVGGYVGNTVPITFAAVSPPTFTVSPSHLLPANGQDQVHVTATGLVPGAPVQLQECEYQPGSGTCNGFLDTTVAADGSLDEPVDVSYVFGPNSTHCDTSDVAVCSVTAAYTSGTGGVAGSQAIDFDVPLEVSPVITSPATALFTVGTPGTFAVTATGTPPVSGFAESGDLDGLVFDPHTGVLSGSPASAGTFPVTFGATNGVSPDASQAFVLTVDAPPVITSPAAAHFTLAATGSFAVAATGTPPVTAFSATGNLDGLTFDPSTGVLSGTPAAVGTYPITFGATNGVAPGASQSFVLTVNKRIGDPPTITSADSATFRVNASHSFKVTTTGLPALSVSGHLPAGVTFHDTGSGKGTLSGTPTVPGAYVLRFAAANGAGTATQNFVLTVQQEVAGENYSVKTSQQLSVDAPGFLANDSTGSAWTVHVDQISFASGEYSGLSQDGSFTYFRNPGLLRHQSKVIYYYLSQPGTTVLSKGSMCPVLKVKACAKITVSVTPG
jgi:hypothetical protein